MSSSSTANPPKTADSAGSAPSLLATSPGRSRSSLLSPRRTPSGIPFFSRKSSNHATTAAGTSDSPALPSSPKSTHSGSQEDRGLEKTGRKSILGINLFHRSSARKSISLKQGEVIPLSPKLPKEYQSSTAASVLSPRSDENVSEFGVRPSNDSKRSSVSAKASSFMGRKRGKVSELPSAIEVLASQLMRLFRRLCHLLKTRP